MGCFESHIKPTQDNSVDKIIQAINFSTPRRLKSLIAYFKSVSSIETLDNTLLPYANYKVNALGLCLLKGKSELFKLLLENQSSLELAEKILLNQDIIIINYLCTKGYIEILQIYFPYYISKPHGVYKISLGQYPIHLACYNGHAQIVLYFYNFFKDSASIPVEFDINALEESTGENCALIGCRKGDLKLVTELYETCGADFGICNNKKEAADMICVIGMNNTPSLSYIDVLDYLIEKVGIDIRESYKELLSISESPLLVKYINEKIIDLIIRSANKSNDSHLESKGTKASTDQNIFTSTFINSEGCAFKSFVSSISQNPQSSDEDIILI
jgi:hypothetical protein